MYQYGDIYSSQPPAELAAAAKGPGQVVSSLGLLPFEAN
jgi:hypothetical protein